MDLWIHIVICYRIHKTWKNQYYILWLIVSYVEKIISQRTKSPKTIDNQLAWWVLIMETDFDYDLNIPEGFDYGRISIFLADIKYEQNVVYFSIP